MTREEILRVIKGFGEENLEHNKRYTAVKLCERFGWTWQEYQKQPYWFINDCLEVLNTEAEIERKEIEKVKRQIRN